MRATMVSCSLLTGLLLSNPAAAWTTPGGVQITNTSGRQVDIWVDGAWRGALADRDTRTFSALPGAHSLQVAWPDGTQLLQSQVNLSSGRATSVQIAPPPTTLALGNHGAAPLWVELPGVTPFWMMPGTDTRLTLHSNAPIPLQASIYGRQGLIPVSQQTLAPCAGHVVQAEIGWTAPTPSTTITVTNLEDHTLRIYVAGQEAAVVPVGQTRSWEVTPGRFEVMVVEHQDGVLFQQTVSFDPRNDHRLRVQRGGATVETTRTTVVR